MPSHQHDRDICHMVESVCLEVKQIVLRTFMKVSIICCYFSTVRESLEIRVTVYKNMMVQACHSLAFTNEM